MEDLTGISERIRSLREDRGLTMAEVAKDIGVPKTTLASWETGRPTLSGLMKLAAYYQSDPFSIFVPAQEKLPTPEINCTIGPDEDMLLDWYRACAPSRQAQRDILDMAKDKADEIKKRFGGNN